ncbi:MAG: histidine ammonia-lyase [Anaerolineales bacterium]|nr:histidine ammonia-lyase [Anaerolineales bacterium]
MDTLTIDGTQLTIEDLVRVADGAPSEPAVALGEAARDRVARAAAAVERLLAEGRVAYGITTGFGAFKDQLIPPERASELQHNILMSHAVGTGEPFDAPTTRAILLIRANTLAHGHSGVRPETLELLLELLNRGVLPRIPSKGSLGASGDLAPLAHMGLVLVGLGEAEYRGETLPGAQALGRAGLAPLRLAAKEGLALTNGTSVMTALGALETRRAEKLSCAADIIGCLSLEALNGTQAAFDERIHQLRPHPRQVACAGFLRGALEGSDFTRPYDPHNIQDAYTLRCIPQVHGAAREAIAYLRWMMEIELNSVTENPLIFIDEASGEVEVLSGGNFHGEPLAIGMDYLGIAMSEIGNISERRLMRLLDANSNGGVLPPFLACEGGLNSGFMLLQYTAAALATENKVLAHPASVDTIPTSANVEDHVSMGATAGLKLRQINANVEHILSLELMAAAQGIDFRRQALQAGARLGEGTRRAYQLVRERVPFIEHDTVMYEYIREVRKLVSAGTIRCE